MRTCVVALVSLATAAWLGSFAVLQGGTIRHDRDPQDYLDLGADPDYQSVGFLTGSADAFDYSCSGTLVSSDHVLTAGHCVDIANSLQFEIGGTTYNATQWQAHPTWTGNVLTGFDAGLVTLDAPVPNVTPAIRYAGMDELDAVGVSAGFGLTGTGQTGQMEFDGEKRAGENVINWVVEDRLLISDFDRPGLPGILNPNVVPLDLEFLIASGDSGGGLFIEDAGQMVLTGVHSFALAFDGDPDSDYGDFSGHTRVSAINDWIDSVLSGGPIVFSEAADLRNASFNGLFLSDGSFGGAPPVSSSNTPEPGTLLPILAGFLLLAARRRKN